MNPAGKLELILNLFDQGLLCKCEETQVGEYDEYTETALYEIIHKPYCEAVQKVKDFIKYD